MPDNLESNIEKLRLLHTILKEVEGSLDSSSSAAQNLTSIINNLSQAISEVGKYSVSLEQIEKAITAITSGAGAQVRLGNVGRFRTGEVSQKLGYTPTTDPEEIEFRKFAALESSKSSENLKKLVAEEEKRLTAAIEEEVNKRISLRAQEREEIQRYKESLQSLRDLAAEREQTVTRVVSGTEISEPARIITEETTSRELTDEELNVIGGQKEADEIARNIQHSINQFKDLKVGEDQLKALNKELEDLGIQSDKFTTFKEKVVDADAGIVKISGNIKLASGKLKEFTKYVDENGQMFDKLPEKITYTADKLDSIFGPELSERVRTTAQELGFDPEDIQEPIDQYADGMRRIKFEKENLAGVTERLTLMTDKYGNVLVDTQKRFRTFFSSIRRNIGEMVKWSAAVVVVWGSLRKLNDLVDLAIKNESELANVAIVLGKNTEDLRDIFDSAAKAAAATGESVDGVIEGYTLAYRATAQYSNEAERAAVTQKLLTDALVLSKLSTLDQAKSIDVLVAGLTQLGKSLDQGDELLNKWMATTKASNVDMRTLAESYSIMGTSAENAGLNMDDLNGIVATLAKAFPYSATEVANSARAIISAFQTESAEEELVKFGISIRNSSGEIRDFMELLEEIAMRYQQGIISNADLQGLSRTLVGGVRRGAQFEALIKDFDNIGKVSVASSEAQADAYDALDVKLNTVQTSLTELSNAFQSLAFTLGEEGGVLDILKSLIGVLDEVLGGIEGVIKGLGTAGPLLLGTLAAGGIAGSSGRRSLAGMLGMTVGGLPFLPAKMQTGLQQGIMGKPDLTFATIGIGAQIASNIIEGLENEDLGSALGQVGGNIGGAFVGYLVGGPFGALIGSAIGEGFVENILQYEYDFKNFFDNVFTDAQEKSSEDEGVVDKRAKLEEKAAEQAAKVIPPFEAAIGSALFSGVLGDIGRKFGSKLPEMTEQQYAIYRAGGILSRPQDYTEEEVKNAQELVKIMQEINKLRQQGEGFNAPKEVSEVVREQTRLLKEYESVLAQISKEQKTALREEFLAGQINIRDYKTALDQLASSGDVATQFFVAFGDTFIEMNDNITNAEDAFEAFTKVMTKGAREVYNELVTIVNEIAVLENSLGSLSGADLTAAKEQIASLKVEASELTNALMLEINRSMLKIPSVITLDELNPQDVAAVIARATELSEDEVAAMIENGLIKGFSTIGEVLATLEPFLLQAGENGGYYYAQGFFSKFLDPAFQQLVEEGLIKPVETASRSLKVFDFPSTQWGAIESRMTGLAEMLRSQGFGDVLDYQDYVALFSDNVARPITADLTLLQLAMQELIDVNEKQLQGIYNLPTDASFVVLVVERQLVTQLHMVY